MKRIALVSLMFVWVLASVSVVAAQENGLGLNNFAFKVDYINFTEEVFEDVDMEGGLYVGVEGYHAIMPNLYLGMELGWASTSNDDDIERIDIDTDIDFVPIELNLKYAGEMAPNLVLGLGAGVSYSYFKIENSTSIQTSEFDVESDDWLFGGQIFADINYKMSSAWFIGVNAKYQFTEEIELEVLDSTDETNTSADNWRIGGQIGFMF